MTEIMKERRYMLSCARGMRLRRTRGILFFYVSKPVKSLDGYAEFIERKLGDPEEAWDEVWQ